MVSFGALIGHVGPRLPTLLLTRGRGFNVHFSEHPEPVALSPHLTQRILHLRAFYWLSFVLAAVVLAFGAVSLRWGSATFGFGLWLSSSWLILSRLQQVLAGRPAPWTYEMAVTLQNIMDQGRTEAACCHHPAPAWGLQAIVCSACGAVLSPEPRPDLGSSTQRWAHYEGPFACSSPMVTRLPNLCPPPSARKNSLWAVSFRATFEKSTSWLVVMEGRPTVGSLIARVGLTGQLLGQIFLTPMAAFWLTYLLVFTAKGGDFRLSIEDGHDAVDRHGFPVLRHARPDPGPRHGGFMPIRVIEAGGWRLALGLTRHKGSSVHRYEARRRYAASAHGRLFAFGPRAVCCRSCTLDHSWVSSCCSPYRFKCCSPPSRLPLC